MIEVFLGIDGGGTKTAFVLEVNKKLYEHKEKTIHLKQISREEFFKRLKNGIEILVKKAGIEISDIDFTFLAMPGFGQFKEDESFILESLEKILGSKNFKVGNDCLNGWAGSLNANAGINLVLGTGSIGFGVDNNGNSMMCGGWGPLLGDEASGYYIGLKILNIFTKISDGRYEKSPIYDLLKKELEISDDFEIITLANNMQRDELASLSKIFSKAIDENDTYALNLLDDVAKEASLVINTLIKKLDFKGAVKVSYSGGVFNLGQRLLDKIEQYADDRVEIVEPFANPSIGSLILAKKFYEKGEMIWF